MRHPPHTRQQTLVDAGHLPARKSTANTTFSANLTVLLVLCALGAISCFACAYYLFISQYAPLMMSIYIFLAHLDPVL